MEDIHFRINNELVKLSLPNEEGTVNHRLKSEHKFAGTYIINLIINGYLSLAEPLEMIYRMDDGRETLVYSSVLVQETAVQEIEEKENKGDFTKTEWTEPETKFLLDLYEANITRVGPMKKFKVKKNMWQHVTDAINKNFVINRTPVQVENRYKTVLKRKKAAVDNNVKSGPVNCFF